MSDDLNEDVSIRSRTGTTGTTGALLTSRLRDALPTPLARGVDLESAPTSTGPQQLSQRISLLELALRFHVAVLDAERATLELARPKALDKLCGRMERSTLGLWGQAAEALAAQLVALRARPLPGFGAWLIGTGRHPDARAAGRRLLGLRNDIAHSTDLASLDRRRARDLLRQSEEDYRVLLAALEPCCELQLVVEYDGHEADDETWRSRVAHFTGCTPTAQGLALSDRVLPFKQPALVAPDGAVLRLRPWMVYEPGQGRPSVLVLDGWVKAGPRYSEPGGNPQVVPLSREVDGAPARPRDWLASFEQRRPRTLRPEHLAELRPRQQAERRPHVRGCRPVRLLGRGGTGAVWLVEDAERDGARLALKVLHPSLAHDREHLHRLAREFEILRKLQIPGVVQVLDFFDDADFGPCLLMEWVEGESLARVVGRGPVSPERAARIVGELLRTLALTHERGVVHRDIKPSNILMQGDQPRLIDFGIARSAEGQTLTRTVEVVGTLAYAAPEQLQGRRAGPAADLYGVGRVLQELLVGREGGEAELVGVAPGLQRVVRRALRPDPEHRFGSAVEMAAALEQARLGGHDGCILGVGDRLPGGLVVTAVGAELEPGIYVVTAETASGQPAAALAPGPAGSARAAFYQRLEALSADLRSRHRCVGVRTTDDGVPFAELAPDRAEDRARELLGLGPGPDGEGEGGAGGAGEPASREDGRDRSAETVLLALGAMAAGAVAAHSLSTRGSDRGGAGRGGKLDGAVLDEVIDGAEARPAPSRRSGSGGSGRGSAGGSGGGNAALAAGAILGATGLAAGLGVLGQAIFGVSRKVQPPTEVPFEAAHHLSLVLLGQEARVGGLAVPEEVWRQAWQTPLGGLLVLLRDLDEAAGPVSGALRAHPERAEIALVARELARQRGPRDARQRGALVGLRVAMLALLQAATPELGRRVSTGPTYLRLHDGTLQIRRERASQGWQAVVLEQAG